MLQTDTPSTTEKNKTKHTTPLSLIQLFTYSAATSAGVKWDWDFIEASYVSDGATPVPTGCVKGGGVNLSRHQIWLLLLAERLQSAWSYHLPLNHKNQAQLHYIITISSHFFFPCSFDFSLKSPVASFLKVVGAINSFLASLQFLEHLIWWPEDFGSSLNFPPWRCLSAIYANNKWHQSRERLICRYILVDLILLFIKCSVLQICIL